MKIIQVPNAYLLMALTGLLISKLSIGFLHKVSLIIYTIAIIIWAYEEVISGVNWFRKLLGVATLLAVAYSLFSKF